MGKERRPLRKKTQDARDRAIALLAGYEERGEKPHNLQSFAREVGLAFSTFSTSLAFKDISDRVREMTGVSLERGPSRAEKLTKAIDQIEKDPKKRVKTLAAISRMAGVSPGSIFEPGFKRLLARAQAAIAIHKSVKPKVVKPQEPVQTQTEFDEQTAKNRARYDEARKSREIKRMQELRRR